MSVLSNTRLEANLIAGKTAGAETRHGTVAPASSWYLPVKAASEFVLALCLLALTAPLLLLAMVLVKLTSRGPALYSQTRVGRGGRPFTLYKIRTMAYQCENLTGACWSQPGDSRITGVGRWLRRTHLDELPQLFNVLKGDMSLVGPRPERPEFVPQLEQAIALYRGRLLVRPGVTGLAQVQLPPDTDLASVRLKLAYDLCYVQHVSCWLDLRIHVATVVHMFGLPFTLIRKIFGFPRKNAVEEAYQWLLTARGAGSGRVKHGGENDSHHHSPLTTTNHSPLTTHH